MINKKGEGYVIIFIMSIVIVGIILGIIFFIPDAPHTVPIDSNVVSTDVSQSYSGGGGGASVPASAYIVQSSPIIISNVRLVIIPDSFDLNLSWDVDNGVGCCNSFGCDFDKFKDSCLVPFKLYDLYLDNVKEDIVLGNNYTYECKNVVPYNYYSFNNVAVGQHTIRLEQRDCDTVQRYIMNISFVLTSEHKLVII
jgi:hypothetical protein